MDADTIRKAARIFEELLERSPKERAKLLDQRCDKNEVLRAFVVELVTGHEDGMGDFLDEPLIGTTLLDPALNALSRFRKRHSCFAS